MMGGGGGGAAHGKVACLMTLSFGRRRRWRIGVKLQEELPLPILCAKRAVAGWYRLVSVGSLCVYDSHLSELPIGSMCVCQCECTVLYCTVLYHSPTKS